MNAGMKSHGNSSGNAHLDAAADPLTVAQYTAPPTQPLLYSFRRCPYAIRARLALHQSGVMFDTVEVDLKRKPPALLALSPAGTVPVMHLPNGQVLQHSMDIMRWALAQTDPAGWLASAEPERDELLMNTAVTAFKHWLDRYKYFQRHPEQTQHAYRQQAVSCLIEPLEAALTAHGPWLGGAQPVLADAAIFPFVRQIAGVEPDWFAASPWAATRHWLQAWAGSTLFTTAMRKVASAAQT